MMSDRYRNWRKATKSNGGDGCVEVSFDRRDDEGIIAVRDSKRGDGSPILEFTQHEWECFTDGVRRSEF